MKRINLKIFLTALLAVALLTSCVQPTPEAIVTTATTAVTIPSEVTGSVAMLGAENEASPSRIVDIAAGLDYCLALLDDGSLWAWGGAFWDAEALERGEYLPQRIFEEVAKVYALRSQVAVIKEDGSLWFQHVGEIYDENGYRSWLEEPFKYTTNVVEIAAQRGSGYGLDGLLILKDDDSLWTVSSKDKSEDLYLRQVVLSSEEPLQGIVNIGAEGNRFYALLADSSLYSWMTSEMNGYSLLYENKWNPPAPPPAELRWDTAVLLRSDVTYLQTNDQNGFLISEDGTLYGWGWNQEGQLGVGHREHLFGLQEIMSDVRLVAPGGYSGYNGNEYYTLILQNDGTLWGTGFNVEGQIAAPFSAYSSSDQPLKIMDGVAKVAAGGYHALALQDDGSLWIWGNAARQLALGIPLGDSATPQKIASGFSSVAAGGITAFESIRGQGHSLGLKTNGSLWGWGNNFYYQLGDGTTESQAEPILIMDDVRSAYAFSTYNFAIKNDDSLWVWGSLWGNLSPTSRRPQKLMEGVAEVGEGGGKTTLLKKDGSLWVWRINAGEIGEMLETEIQPEMIETQLLMEQAVAIVSGGNQTMAIDADHILWSFEVLGKDSEQPGEIRITKIMEDVQQMANAISKANESHFVLKTDGTLWCWGSNWSNKLGLDSGGADIVEPAFLMDQVTYVSTAPTATLAIKEDGSLWQWGARQEPEQMLTRISAASANSHHFLAVDEDGNLWSWGSNRDGQLGNGMMQQYYKPQKATILDYITTGR